VLANDGDVVAVYPTDGGPPRHIPNLEEGFTPLRWSLDNASIYGYRPGQLPAKLYKVNVATGAKNLVQELQPENATGVVLIAPVVVNRDASRFAYSYYQMFSVLYLVSGLQ
jgi:hypothetical protein